MPRWLTFSSAWTPGNLVGLVGPWRISGSKKLRDVPVLSDATVFAVRIHSARVLVFLGCVLGVRLGQRDTVRIE